MSPPARRGLHVMLQVLLPTLLALAAADARPVEPWQWEPVPTAPTGPFPPTPLAPPPAGPPAPPPGSWLDEGHAFVSSQLEASVERLDRFFGDDRPVDRLPSHSWLRWRSELRVQDNGRLLPDTSLRAELRIPSLDRRLEALRVTLSGGTTDTLDRILSADPPGPDTTNQGSAGLRLLMVDALRTQTDVSAGMLFGWPPGWFVKSRYRQTVPLGDLLMGRGALTVFWQTPTGWGTRVDADLERHLAPRVLLRLADNATITERSRGWEWASELGVLAALDQRTALSVGGGPQGATALGNSVEIWRVHGRLRRDVHRRWLFVEVEPGIDWTRPEGGGRRRIRYVVFRLEFQFDALVHPSGGAPPAP